MNLDYLSLRSAVLTALLQQHRTQRQTTEQIKKLLPVNLQGYVQAALLHETSLTVFTAHAIAASRLKMFTPVLLPQLQRDFPQLQNIHIKIMPEETPVTKQGTFRLPENAVPHLSETAEKLSRHPRLAAAFKRLLANRNR